MAINFKDVKDIQWLARKAYTEIEYIYCNGSNNYIDTGDVPSNRYTYREITIKDINVPSGQRYAKYFFGEESTASAGEITCIKIGPYLSSADNINHKEIDAMTGCTAETAVTTLYSDYTTAPLNQKMTYGVYLEDYQLTQYIDLRLNGIVKDSSGTVVKQTYVSAASGYNNYSGSQSIYLMAGHSDNNDAQWFTEGKLYRYKKYSSYDGTLQGDFIPCIRKSDGVIGMYDTVGGTFHALQGTTSGSTAGPRVSENPSWAPAGTTGIKMIKDANNNILWGSQAAYPYRRLEYIHFNGAEYIDTGITDNATKYRETTVSLDSDETPSSDIYILGSRDTSIDAAKQRYWLPRIDGNGIRFVVGSAWTSNNAYPVATYMPANTKRIVYGKTSTSSNNMKLEFGIKDGSGNTLTSGNITGGAVSGFNSRKLALMATNDGSGSTGMSPKGYCAGKVYSFIERQTNSSGTLLHNFIPCQRKSDNICGMYDVVTGTFYPMQGTTTGNAAAGTVINEYWDLTV